MFNIDKRIVDIADIAEGKCRSTFNKFSHLTEYNQQKMLKAFIDVGVSEAHFFPTTGYGYGDRGREALDNLYARVFGAESALVRHNFVNGTHAIAVALFGILRPKDKMLSVTGMPYDTMKSVIGIAKESPGSLKDFGVDFDYVETDNSGIPDYGKIETRLSSFFKVIYIQRSRGYSLKNSISLKTIKELIEFIRQHSPKSIVIVDNCYGEFVCKDEPTGLGADLIAGSLIKNPGGGIAPSGGYIAGKKNLVELCSYRLTVPGSGGEVGATLGHSRELFMGAFNAPHVVGQALKSAIFAAAFFKALGYDTYPGYDEDRSDIIQAIRLGDPGALESFCRGIQKGSPVDSMVCPKPWDMPGYDCKIIMAAGTFTMGSSIELSADAPLREPYAVWLQGGINFHSAKVGIMMAAQNMLNEGFLNGF